MSLVSIRPEKRPEDRRIDEYIQNLLSEISPPMEDIRKTNPLYKPFTYIIIGYMLTVFTLNFKNLQYILPTIGMLMLVYGVCMIRSVNPSFQLAWFCILFQLIWHLVSLVSLITPLYNKMEQVTFLSVILIGVKLLFLYAVHNGIMTQCKVASVIIMRTPFLAAILWQVLILLLAILQIGSSWLIMIPIMICLIANIHSMFQLREEIRTVGYTIKNSSIKFSFSRVVIGYLFLVAIGMLVFGVLANHLPLKEQKSEEQAMMDERQDLIQKGFPEDVLLDLSDENISLLVDANYVQYTTEVLEFDPKTIKIEISKNKYRSEQVPGNINMRATTVYIEKENLNYVVVHFNWDQNKAYWQDGFSITGEDYMELLDGKLRYEKSGCTYEAPIPRLQCGMLSQENFFGSTQGVMITGAVSYPFGTNKQRGYVFYRYELPSIQYFGSNCMNYYHSKTPYHFPYVKAEDLSFGWTGRVQHYTNFTTKLRRENQE